MRDLPFIFNFWSLHLNTMSKIFVITIEIRLSPYQNAAFKDPNLSVTAEQKTNLTQLGVSETKSNSLILAENVPMVWIRLTFIWNCKTVVDEIKHSNCTISRTNYLKNLGIKKKTLSLIYISKFTMTMRYFFLRSERIKAS